MRKRWRKIQNGKKVGHGGFNDSVEDEKDFLFLLFFANHFAADSIVKKRKKFVFR